MSQTKRYQTRADISVDDVSDERKSELRTAFDQAEYGERIQQCVAATFEVNEAIEQSGVVLSSWLHHDRIFDLVASYGSGEDVRPNEYTASATVKDLETGDKLAAHVSENRVLVSLRNEDASFESFVAYVLFIEQRLSVELTPVIE